MSEDTHTITAPKSATQEMFDSVHEFEIRRSKQFREYLNTTLQSLRNSSPSRERSLAITKIQEAIAWLGEDCTQRGDGGGQ